MKREMREHMRRIVSGLPKRAVSLPPHLATGRAILVFLSMPGEVDITPIAHEAWRAGKTVAAPRLNRADRSMTPARIGNFDGDVVPVPGIPGLSEPRQGLEEVPVADIDCVLVPGLAFDRRGNRLGRGAGYYDRFLSRLSPGARIIGVCFDEQIVDSVPVEPHDVQMHALLTPSGLIELTS